MYWYIYKNPMAAQTSCIQPEWLHAPRPTVGRIHPTNFFCFISIVALIYIEWVFLHKNTYQLNNSELFILKKIIFWSSTTMLLNANIGTLFYAHTHIYTFFLPQSSQIETIIKAPEANFNFRGIALCSSKALLVPYSSWHVPRYHEWMKDPVSKQYQ